MHSIETERLLLRPSTDDEFEGNYRILVEEIEGAAFTREAYIPEFRFDLYLAQQNLGRHFWRPSIYLKHTQRFIGYCLLMPQLCVPGDPVFSAATGDSAARFSSIEAEIGWALSERYRNHGYATEAARALVEYGFRTLQLPRIIAFTHPDNAASMRVMQKLGMRIHQLSHGESVVGVITNEQ